MLGALSVLSQLITVDRHAKSGDGQGDSEAGRPHNQERSGRGVGLCAGLTQIDPAARRECLDPLDLEPSW